VYLVGIIYYNIITMHGPMNIMFQVKLKTKSLHIFYVQ